MIRSLHGGLEQPTAASVPENFELESQDQLATSSVVRETTTSWVCSYPFFETAVLLAPSLLPVSLRAISSGAISSEKIRAKTHQLLPVTIVVYDCDGALVNQVELEIPAGRPQVIELQPYLAACKLESGLRYGTVHVLAPKEVSVHMRTVARDSAASLGEGVQLTSAQGGFFPLAISTQNPLVQGASKQVRNVLAISNSSNEEVQLRARLFIGKRSPESAWQIPAFGARVVFLESEFRPYVSSDEKHEQRLSTADSTSQSIPFTHSPVSGRIQEEESEEIQNSKGSTDESIPAYVRLTARSGKLQVHHLELTLDGGISAVS